MIRRNQSIPCGGENDCGSRSNWCTSAKWLWVGLSVVLVVSLWTTRVAAAQTQQRVVFLGDSITDGNTYPLLVEQALREAGSPMLACFNAGIGGDTSGGMLKRLDRDVFRHKPTLVTISAGINDSFASVAVGDFERNIASIVGAVQAHGAEAVLLTTTVVKDKSPKTQQRLDGYNAAIRSLAKQRKLRLVEVYQVMDAQPDAVARLLVADGVHPNYQGQSLIARAVLNGLGYEKVQLPKALKLEVLPGVIRQWHMRPAAKDELALSDVIAAKLDVHTCTATVNVPGDAPGDPSVWTEQEHHRGFVQGLGKQVGPGDRFFGIARVKSAGAQSAVLNTGAALKAVYLNGKQVFVSSGWAGWHAFKEQIPVQLQAGENTLVVETGDNFFLSLTDADGRTAISQSPTYPGDVPDTMNDGNGLNSKGWLDRHAKHVELARRGKTDVYFAGDSITDGWQESGKEAWNKYFAPLNAGNFGIYGDETQHVAWRLRNGGLEGVKAKVAVLLIGTNNLGAHADESAEEVARGVQLCVDTFRQRVPGIKVLILGIFPRGEGTDSPLRQRIVAVNRILAAKADGTNVFYQDIGHVFLARDGSVDRGLVPDLSHPSAKGYVVFAEAIVPTVRQLLGLAETGPTR